jgi:uncharacterized membrane protein
VGSGGFRRQRARVTLNPEGEAPIQPFSEGDLKASANKDSPGRLLVLSDGVFAIALTLLALDLHVPDVGDNPTNRSLQHALSHQSSAYFSFLISFYVVASYWTRHRRAMRSVESVDPTLVRYTLILLLCVAALPFPAALLGKYASHPISLAIYGALNVVASVDLLLLHRTVHKHHLSPSSPAELVLARREMVELLSAVVVFALCIPAAYLFHGNGAWALVLLLVVQRWRTLVARLGRLRKKREPVVEGGA